MRGNIVSVSFGDHLMFGEGEGRLDRPLVLERRMRAWRDELGARIVHWRTERVAGRLEVGDGLSHPRFERLHDVSFDDFRVVPELAHGLGMEAHLYVSLFDEGWPLPPPEVRAVSYHNAMHGRDVAWQSDFAATHPEWLIQDRDGRSQWGVFCLAHPEVRRHFRERWLALLDGSGFDGLFVCLRSQSRPADHADRYGFNPPVRADFLARTGIPLLDERADRQAWRDLLGSYLTRLFGELRHDLTARRLKLGIGCARGDVLGPPLGNATLAWREWLERGIPDHLVIGQNSCRCPSMGHELWPMHRGEGYLQDYLTGAGLPPLLEQIEEIYAPSILSLDETDLFIARQWDARDAAREAELLTSPAVSGLVFGSFRHDNPEVFARGEWGA